jgi:hypothetical protein
VTLWGRRQQCRHLDGLLADVREALTEAVAEGVPTNDVAWTATGETVGVIRLVPVRPGLLRTNGVSAAPAETVIAIDVSGGGDHAAGALAEWLRADELAGRVRYDAASTERARVGG